MLDGIPFLDLGTYFSSFKAGTVVLPFQHQKIFVL
jgi:hypothetical protein